MITENGYLYGYVEHPSTIRRLADFPVDESSVFNTYEEAKIYAETNPIAYETQLIGVKDTHEIYQIKEKKLVPLQSSSINMLKECFGYWAISDLVNGITGRFEMDIPYPIIADQYEVFASGTSISGKVNIGEGFTTAKIMFEEANIIQVKIYNKSIELAKFNAIPIFNNDKLLCGILSTYVDPSI